ncbi:MAG: hypothetical protein ABEH89_00380 [bacterium]
MTRRLSRIIYIVLLLVVAVTLIVNLPPLEKIGRTPTSEFVTFSLNHWVTEVHRNLKKARHAELRGDNKNRTNGPDSKRYYRNSLYYYAEAEKYAKRRGEGSYLNDLIQRAQSRVHKKLANG